MKAKKMIPVLTTAMVSAACLLFTGVNAQDIHFSHYNEAPLTLNPALCGVSYNYRAAVLYRDQWRSVTVPYVTYGGSFEARIKLNAWEKVGNNLTQIYKKAFRKVAAGLAFYNDRAGDGALSTIHANFSLSTRVQIDDYTFVAAGVQGGIIQKKVDFSKFIWPDQFVGTGYDTGVDPGENFNSSSFIHGDFSGGILYAYDRGEKAIRANNELRFDAGISAFHINQPTQRWLGGSSEKLGMRYVIHTKCLFGIKNSTISVYPSFVFMLQGRQKEILFGSLLRYHFKDDSKFTGYIKATHAGFGAHYRNRDALIPSAFIEFGTVAIGMSYDVNLSKLHYASQYKGGFEVFLRFNGATPFIYQNAPSF
ncbi:MAG: PorP/SprF family type IX secretion system membrane protein [Bacteroidia bacterium]|nr:PorP/SprF family type IX secretion system membrane protein [Bacteroidia bacterium]